ncbi:MAG: patatin-like protein [Reyranellaceae bacterium]
MRERELRIALVCFGGVSLATYMHGVTKELLKLVRGSSALHDLPESERATARFEDRVAAGDPEYDTDSVYFEVLREIGRTVGLRVVIDVIAGASAGGINGALLARALSHDLPMGPLRDLWLDRADVTELLAPEARAGTFSKMFLKPIEWSMGAIGRVPIAADREARSKLSLFVRSRWFKPPLSGDRMAELMYDAMLAMEAERPPGASLLPSGHKLDLFVTLTDHYGYQRLVRIHQPPIIHEHEHRHVLHFRYERRPGGLVSSDFDLDAAPGLAFAARATSSFPGAFPPARIAEIDALLHARDLSWPRRAEFIARNFEPYTRTNIDPASVYFVDGSVLNNRPFRQAIAAIRGRPAWRQVDRRLVYIDPDPAPPGAPSYRREPGFFTMLKGALSDLPSNQPVADELNWVDEYNDRVDRLREIIRDARPRISERVAGCAGEAFATRGDREQVRRWREQATVAAQLESGFACEGYMRLRLTAARRFLAGLIAELRGVAPRSPMAHLIAQVVEAWAAASGCRLASDAVAADGRAGPWERFLRDFDVDHARRGLHFLIEGQNRLYERLDQPDLAGVDEAVVDGLKRQLYERLDALDDSERQALADPALRDAAGSLFQTAPAETGEGLQLYARRFAERQRTALDALVGGVAKALGLDAHADALDGLMAELDSQGWQPEARREVLINHLGFPFWDLLTFPLMTWRETGEFNRILVDRLSPEDAQSLAPYSGARSLRGARLGHFAGFLARGYRENDYLLGRLHALDRLIDIVCNSAGLEAGRNREQIAAWKARGFTRILDAEEAHLPNSAGLVAELRRVVERLRQA